MWTCPRSWSSFYAIFLASGPGLTRPGWSSSIFRKANRTRTPTSNALTRTYREEVLNLYLFRNLAEVRETTHWWRLDYNERRPHGALGGRTPAECINQNAQNSTFELSP